MLNNWLVENKSQYLTEGGKRFGRREIYHKSDWNPCRFSRIYPAWHHNNFRKKFSLINTLFVWKGQSNWIIFIKVMKFSDLYGKYRKIRKNRYLWSTFLKYAFLWLEILQKGVKRIEIKKVIKGQKHWGNCWGVTGIFHRGG